MHGPFGAFLVPLDMKCYCNRSSFIKQQNDSDFKQNLAHRQLFSHCQRNSIDFSVCFWNDLYQNDEGMFVNIIDSRAYWVRISQSAGFVLHYEIGEPVKRTSHLLSAFKVCLNHCDFFFLDSVNKSLKCFKNHLHPPVFHTEQFLKLDF